MKIPISSFCWRCFHETSKTKEDYELLKKDTDIDLEVEVNDENIYVFTCPKGHKSVTQLQEQKFEVLMDLAAMALLDGYTREGVASLASSLERFIQFYVQVICIKSGIAIDEFNKTSGLVSRQSERQLGAFYFLKLLNTKSSPEEIGTSWVSFRNRVIHQGYIPTTREAIEYGDYVLSYIFRSLKELKTDSQEALSKATIFHLTKNREKIPENASVGNASIPTIVNLRSVSSDDFGIATFKEALDSISKNSFYQHFYRKKSD
jgi:hypothetical protein